MSDQGEGSHETPMMKRTSSAILIFFLIVFCLLLYVPHITTIPPVYEDDFLLSEAGYSFYRDWSLRCPLSSCPFSDSEILGGKEQFSLYIEAGYFVAQGLFYKLFGYSITAARLFSALSAMVYILALFVLFRRLFGVGVAFLTSILFLLDSRLWFVARTVRPDCITAFFVISGIYLLVTALRDIRLRLLVLAGSVCIGIACSMHPNIMVYIPALLMLAVCFAREKRWKELVGGFLSFIAVQIPYLYYITAHWDRAMDTVRLHNAQLGLEKNTHGLWQIISNEQKWFSQVYHTDYTVATEVLLGILMLLSLCCCSACALWGLYERVKKKGPLTQWTQQMVMALFVPASMEIVFALFVTDKSFIYQVHILPWLYLLVALTLNRVIQSLIVMIGKKSSAEGAPALAAYSLAAGALVYFLLSYQIYAKDLRQGNYLLSYEKLISIASDYVPEGSVLFSSPNGWPVAVKSRALFLQNQMYELFFPHYTWFPWYAQRAPRGHVQNYVMRPECMERLRVRSGKEILYLLDEYDWGWNGYYPNGALYGQSYASLQSLMSDYFTPVLKIFSRDRGMVVLYKYGNQLQNPALYLEDKKLNNRVKRDLYVTGKRQISVNDANPITRQVDFTTLQEVKGKIIRLRLRYRCIDGAQCVLCFQRRGTARYFDSTSMLEFEYYRRCTEQHELVSLFFISAKGSFWIEELAIDEVE